MPIKQTKKKYLKPRIFVEDYLEELCEDDVNVTSSTQVVNPEDVVENPENPEIPEIRGSKAGDFDLNFNFLNDDYTSDEQNSLYE